MAFNYFDEMDQVFDPELLARAAVPPAEPVVTIFEDAGEDGAIGDFADKQLRSAAMSVALSWVSGGDFSFDALDILVQGVADLDEDGEVGDVEEDYYNDLLAGVAEALIALGGDSDNVLGFFDSEDAEAGAKLGVFLSDALDGVSVDDDTIITNFAMGGDIILEGIGDLAVKTAATAGRVVGAYHAAKAGNYKTVKAIVNGKLVRKSVRRKGAPKVRLSAAQRLGLKKARRKATTSAAIKLRSRSLKKRKSMGL